MSESYQNENRLEGNEGQEFARRNLVQVVVDDVNWKVLHQDKGVSGVRDHRLKNFSWTGEELIKRSSTEEQ